eukprot:gene32555-17274_t
MSNSMMNLVFLAISILMLSFSHAARFSNLLDASMDGDVGMLTRDNREFDFSGDSSASDSSDEDSSALVEVGSESDGDVNQADPDDRDFCYSKEYRKRTLKTMWEMPFIGLFSDLRNQTKFEASGATIAKGYAWVIFDSLRTVGRISLDFNFRSEDNILVPEKDEEEEESQFEGIEYSPETDTFLIVTEVYIADGDRLQSRTEEVKMADDYSSFEVIRECLIDFTFEHENKGFEGIYYFKRDNHRYFMGLCESNYCKTSSGEDAPGREKGHGRLVLAKMVEIEGGDCNWQVEKIIHIPTDAYFTDYSEIAFHGLMGPTVAVTSQEDAAVWVGKFDWENLEFEEGGTVFHFPRNDHCEMIYCNVEGIHFLDEQRLFVTTDKSKSKQPHHCMHKDQMAMVMALGSSY